MARTPRKKIGGPVDLSALQIWHLQRGAAIWRFSFADRRPRPCPFDSEEQRREAWFANRSKLLAMAGERLPDGLAASLGLSLRYRGAGVTWASRQFPSAYYDFEGDTGREAVDISTGPDGPATENLQPPQRRTPDGALTAGQTAEGREPPLGL